MSVPSSSSPPDEPGTSPARLMTRYTARPARSVRGVAIRSRANSIVPSSTRSRARGSAAARSCAASPGAKAGSEATAIPPSPVEIGLLHCVE